MFDSLPKEDKCTHTILLLRIFDIFASKDKTYIITFLKAP